MKYNSVAAALKNVLLSWLTPIKRTHNKQQAQQWAARGENFEWAVNDEEEEEAGIAAGAADVYEGPT